MSDVSAKIHPSSSLFMRNPAPAAVAYLELVETVGKDGGVVGGKKLYMRNVSQIKKSWVKN